MSREKGIWTPPSLGTLTSADFDMSPREREFITRSRQYLRNLQAHCDPFSLDFYFSLVAQEGLQALERGNYGIGAIYIYNHNGREIIIGSHNRAYSGGDSSAHAEHELLNAVDSLAGGHSTYVNRIKLRRKTMDKHDRRILVAGMEPCVSCVEKLLNHGAVTDLWIGRAEPDSGSVLDGRDRGLHPRKRKALKEQIKISLLANSIDPELSKMLGDMFFNFRSKVYLRLQQRKEARMENFEANVARFSREAKSGGFRRHGYGKK